MTGFLFLMRTLLFLFIFTSITQAQVPELYKKTTDSLQRVLETSKEDSNKVKTLMELLNVYIDFDMSGANEFGRMANDLSKKINYRFGIGRSYYSLATIAMNGGHNKTADSLFSLSEEIFRDLKREDRLAMIYNGRGNLAFMQGNYWLAGDYYTKATEVYEKLRDTADALTAYQNLIAVLGETNNYERAIILAKKSLTIAESIQDTIQAPYALQSLLVNYCNLGNLEEASKYIDPLFRTAETTVDFNIAAEIYNSIGNYYFLKKEWQQSLVYFKKGLAKAETLGNQYLVAQLLKSVGAAHLKLKNYPSAKTNLDSALLVADKSNNRRAIYETSFLLGEYFQQTGKPSDANRYLMLHLELKDSILNADTRNHVSYLEALFESNKKELEIENLKLVNVENELSVVKKNRILVAGSIGAAALLLILGLLYRSSKQKQLIAEKEQQVQHQQIQFLEKQQQLVSMQSMINGQETERTRIAKDLHDGLGGLFSTLKMYFSTLQHEVSDLKQSDLFQKSISLVGTASTEVRRIAHNMMPESLMKLGLTNAVKDLCDNISAGKLLQVSLEVHGMKDRLNSSTEIMLYRIIQELLNNIIKHAQASEAIIQFIRDDNRLSIVVEDNGRGFNTESTDEAAHAGIETVKSRVNYLNGKLTIDSQKGIGTTVMMDFLINEEEAAS